MPELPEVETVRRTLLPHVKGQPLTHVVVSDTRLRRPVPSKALLSHCGTSIIDVRRRAKYLLIDLSDAHSLLIHLGMSGNLFVVPKDKPARKHDHVVWSLGADRELRFNDPRRFGMVDIVETASAAQHESLAVLGVEPFSEAFSTDFLFEATRGSTKPIKTLLMDAGVVVGVGNIYASEALFAARVHPLTQCKRLTRAACAAIVEAVVMVLDDAITQGGTTLRDFTNADGGEGYFAVRLRVYDRAGEACKRCQGKIQRRVLTGRSTYYCAGCQKKY